MRERSKALQRYWTEQVPLELAALAEAAAAAPRGRAVVLGAGVGASAVLLAALGYEVVAVEPSDAASAAIAEAGVTVVRAVVFSFIFGARRLFTEMFNSLFLHIYFKTISLNPDAKNASTKRKANDYIRQYIQA